MKLSFIRHIFSALTLFLILFIVSSCGGTAPQTQQNANTDAENGKQKEKMSDIEQLLGIESQQSQEKTKPKEGNDDLLTLLGAEDKPKEIHSKEKKNESIQPVKKQEEMKQQPQKTKEETKPAAKKSMSDDNNEKALKEKDAEIQQLKNELMDKDQKIARLESTPPPATSTPIVVDNITDAEYGNLYEQGLNLFKDRNYKEAITVFERLIASNDQNNLSDNAQYWIGESHYMLGKYKDAIMDFEKVFSYNKNNKRDYAQFKLGKCYARLGDKQRAREEFQRFIKQYPKSELIRKAEKELSALQ